jgi:hypothetical protein
LPLARILTQPELGAVIGHELGHFEGSDTKFSRWFYPIYRGTSQALSGLHEVARGEGAQAESRLGREREIAADAVGAKATNPRAWASALMKVHAFAPLWTNLYEEMREMLQQKKQFINASSYWASKVATGLQRNPNFIAEIDTSTTDVGHPTDTHPPLAVRLKSLQVPNEVFVEDAAQCSPVHPAIELIPEHDELEKHLSDIESALLANSMNISPESNVEAESRSEHVAGTSDETSAADFAELIELLTSKQVRIYALSNSDLQSAFSKVIEAVDSPGDLGRLTVDFVAQAARIAGRPLPKSSREIIDFLKEQSQEARPDPKLIGDLLSYAWLDGRFQSDVSALGTESKPEIQKLVEGWLRVWWLYLFRLRVAMKYGNDFTSLMMDQVHQKFRKLAELDHDYIGLSGRIDYWVMSLDDSITTFKDMPLGKEKAPAEYISALCFLMKDSESPYYKQSKIEDAVDTKLALALVAMRAKVTEWIDFYI